MEARSVEELAGAVAIPDADVLLLQQLGIGGSFDEPEQFFSDGAPENALRGQQRELIPKIEAHLGAKDADGSNTSAIATSDT
jgi:hypothetical protein